MRHAAASVEALLAHLHALVGQTVTIRASLSRRRTTGGHNRHCATIAQFSLPVESVGCTISGAQLFLLGAEGAWYGMAWLAVVAWSLAADGSLIITEQFEAETERRTEIIPATTVARRTAERAARHAQLGIALPESKRDEPGPEVA
ncbi:MAG TPA: hypothetical protein VGE07_10195 [Herpetosiphonaceae bacterium]